MDDYKILPYITNNGLYGNFGKKSLVKKTVLLFVFISSAMFCLGQNLVPNGSFEEYYHCPNNTSEVDSCIGWYNVLNTPDYFDTCSAYPVSMPDNFCGYQYPFQGNGCVGLFTYAFFPTNYREIIGTQLLDTMIPGVAYHISLRVSRGNWTIQNYNVAASNKLGLRFTTYIYTLPDTPIINNFAQVYEDSIIDDTLNWVLLHWDFRADSSYSHVYIGNFFDDAHTDTVVINPPLGNFGNAYYYVDSINIYCVAGCPTGINNTSNTSFDVWYNPATRNIIIHTTAQQNAEVSVYNIGGQLVINNFHFQGVGQLNVPELSAGMYFVLIRSNNQFTVKRIIIP